MRIDGRNGAPFIWFKRDFIGIRIFGWQFDIRTPGHHRLFSERIKGCGYRANLHIHAECHKEYVGLCFRATRLGKPRMAA
jgi:hypothetical protein